MSEYWPTGGDPGGFNMRRPADYCLSEMLLSPEKSYYQEEMFQFPDNFN